MSDCLFCKIVEGVIPCHKVYDDDYSLAFLDIHPCSKGHTVVIPKKHFVNIVDIDMETWGHLSTGLKQAAARVEIVVKPDGMNIGLNNNPVAGQAVAHLHWHIIPRYYNDGGGSMHSIVRMPDSGDVAALANNFKS
ncbi:MAG: hypothetical protein A2261_03545 [Candidatus Magasanikbacteria bacterium RIFOXYA2_FULL_44_8]|uniref:HIT domain-containing protein n=1 Tax=Candidatus Magasanikbacteria bacterium RIFOXYA2_FULL_44_8 TaxID=1798696 RepID=A0A1F6NIL4_9BACT|nr:MAG: hypothetical protein A2261_03545 [Candidatus Magasanikbacteria bacterium RIFOXYA2_FULL_44_8]